MKPLSSTMTLAVVVRRDGQRDHERVATLGRGLAGALAHAHALGVVHRDVSPSNVLLSVDGDVKLGDFGIAQALLRQSFPQASLTERTKGKLGYLAPEQVRGQPSYRRADVFAAGVVASNASVTCQSSSRVNSRVINCAVLAVAFQSMARRRSAD